MGLPTDYTVKNLKRQRIMNNSLHFFLNADIGLVNSAPKRVFRMVTRAHCQIFKSSLLHNTPFIYDLFQYTINTKPKNRLIHCPRVHFTKTLYAILVSLLYIRMTQHAVSTYISIF